MSTPRFQTEYKKADLPALKARVQLSALIGQVVALKRAGVELVGLCPFHQEKTPSFSVNDQKGLFTCHGCGEGGDAISWLQKTESLEMREAIRRLGIIAGEMEQDMPRERRGVYSQKVEAPANAGSAIQNLLTLWRAGAKLRPESPAWFYLRGRGIELGGIDMGRIGGVRLESFRFHPSVMHIETKQRMPALITQIVNSSGEMIGLHRTFLAARDGKWVKAPVTPAKKMMGHHRGGFAQLTEFSPRLCLAEGIETALSVMQATRMPCWAALSLGNMETVELPLGVKQLVLCVDNDMKDDVAAEKSIQRAAWKHASWGYEVRIARPRKGYDFNDMLMEGV